MTKPATKKSPTSSSGKSTDVRPQVATPKGTATSVPVPATRRAGMTWPHLECAQARIDLLLDRLGSAKDERDPVPLGTADAAALFDVANDAAEDLSELLAALRGGSAEVGQ